MLLMLVVMARTKRIYILIIKVNKLFSFSSSRFFLKEIENMYFVFLSSYRNTRERTRKSCGNTRQRLLFELIVEDRESRVTEKVYKNKVKNEKKNKNKTIEQKHKIR